MLRVDEQKVLEHWKTLIEKIFPKNAEFDFDKENAKYFKISVVWKLLYDNNRPNKHSLPYIINITAVAFEAYLGENDQNKGEADNKFYVIVQKDFETHDFDHNYKVNETKPPIELTIKRIDLFSFY